MDELITITDAGVVVRSERIDLSAVWCSGFERRFHNGGDRKVDGSTPNQASLLHSWIRCFTMVISALWNLTSSESKKSEAKLHRKIRKQRQLLCESGFVLRITLSLLSRDRKTKIKKSISSTSVSIY